MGIDAMAAPTAAGQGQGRGLVGLGHAMGLVVDRLRRRPLIAAGAGV
jgi:hypothetical protein